MAISFKTPAIERKTKDSAASSALTFVFPQGLREFTRYAMSDRLPFIPPAFVANLFNTIQMKIIFLVICWSFGLLQASSVFSQPASGENRKPNILVIMTDQQNAYMMSCTGNKWLHTPAMDAMAAAGIRFSRTYVTNPVCSPSRFSLMTGRYPTFIGMRENTVHGIDKEKLESLYPQSIGPLLRKAGYETIYGGKAHFPGIKYDDVEPWGFERLTLDERDGLAADCADFLLNRKKDDQPFLLFASFINPHDICGDAILYAGKRPDIGYIKDIVKEELAKAKQLPAGVTEEEFFDKYCPPLPPNHAPMIGETSEVDRFVKLRPFQDIVREQWTEKDWRMHRWAYMRLTERVDGQIGIVMDALKRSGLADNTIVIFTSDHGDHDGAHKLEHKTLFYEESAGVPFIVIYPWADQKGVVDNKHLVNNGLDLLPTLCSFAGITPPSDLPGRSLLPLLTREKKVRWRSYTIIENQMGFLIHTGRYKYELDDQGAVREMFVDLKADPGETRNLINERRYKKKIRQLRAELLSYLKQHNISVDPPVAGAGS